jgi:hypothetical protein
MTFRRESSIMIAIGFLLQKRGPERERAGRVGRVVVVVVVIGGRGA